MKKSFYFFQVALFLLSTIGFVFFRLQVLFFILGYNSGLINSGNLDSFTAYRRIAPAKLWWLVLTILFSLSTVWSSVKVIRKNGGVLKYGAKGILIVSILTSIVLLFGFIVSFFIPTNVLQ